MLAAMPTPATATDHRTETPFGVMDRAELEEQPILLSCNATSIDVRRRDHLHDPDAAPETHLHESGHLGTGARLHLGLIRRQGSCPFTGLLTSLPPRGHPADGRQSSMAGPPLRNVQAAVVIRRTVLAELHPRLEPSSPAVPLPRGRCTFHVRSPQAASLPRWSPPRHEWVPGATGSHQGSDGRP